MFWCQQKASIFPRSLLKASYLRLWPLCFLSLSSSWSTSTKFRISHSLHHTALRQSKQLFSTMSSFAIDTTSLETSRPPWVHPRAHRRGFVDVHAHIIHEQFEGKEDDIANACKSAELDFVIVNGLEPVSNRRILEYCSRFPDIMLPALGIYPLDAACHVIYTQADITRMRTEIEQDSSLSESDRTARIEALPAVNWHHDFAPPAKFDIDAEIAFIESHARAGTIVAIGECGLDGHYLTDEKSIEAQVYVLRRLVRIGIAYDLPVILHSRKMEQRVFDLLKEEGVVKADFHCYGGKLPLALEIAAAGYYLSIPSAIASATANSASSSFHKLAAQLPASQLLTETDSPYMGPVKGMNNTPVTVVQSIDVFAQMQNAERRRLREKAARDREDQLKRAAKKAQRQRQLQEQQQQQQAASADANASVAAVANRVEDITLSSAPAAAAEVVEGVVEEEVKEVTREEMCSQVRENFYRLFNL